jgi:hypothetical protein
LLIDVAVLGVGGRPENHCIDERQDGIVIAFANYVLILFATLIEYFETVY